MSDDCPQGGGKEIKVTSYLAGIGFLLRHYSIVCS